jgi:hypothetical protein
LICPYVCARAYVIMLILHTPYHQTHQASLEADLRATQEV